MRSGGKRAGCLFLCLWSLLPDQHYDHAGPQGHSAVLDSPLINGSSASKSLSWGLWTSVSPSEEKCARVCLCGRGGYWILLNLYDSNLKVLHFIDNLGSSKHTQAAHMLSIQDLNKQIKKILYTKRNPA